MTAVISSQPAVIPTMALKKSVADVNLRGGEISLNMHFARTVDLPIGQSIAKVVAIVYAGSVNGKDFIAPSIIVILSFVKAVMIMGPFDETAYVRNAMNCLYVILMKTGLKSRYALVAVTGTSKT